jgi:hypothetical protein
MFIKVEIKSGSVITYLLSKADVSIGSSPQCHIVLKDKSISKKHVKIIREGNQWQILDQGSTNGTFLDEEKLIPGKRYEITTNSIVTLGNTVIMTLLTEAKEFVELSSGITPAEQTPTSKDSGLQSSTQDQSDRTRVISLDDIKNAQAIALKKKRQELEEKRAQDIIRKKKDKKRTFIILIISFFVILAGVFANNSWKKKFKKVKKDTIVKKLKAKTKASEDIVSDIEGFRVSRAALIKRNTLVDFMKKPRCLTEEEIEYCQENNRLSHSFNGVLFIQPSSYIFYLEEDSESLIVKRSIDLNSKLDQESFQKLVFLNSFKEQFSQSPLKDNGIYYFTFYKIDENKQPFISYVVAIDASSAGSLLPEIKDQFLLGADDELRGLLGRVNTYFTLY